MSTSLAKVIRGAARTDKPGASILKSEVEKWAGPIKASGVTVD